MASRVPLLVTGKSRKPSRVSIAPRAKPSNALRAHRPATLERSNPPNDALTALKPVEEVKLADEMAASPQKNPILSTQKSAEFPSQVAKVKHSTVSISTSSAEATLPRVTEPAAITVVAPIPTKSVKQTGTVTNPGTQLTSTPSVRHGLKTHMMPSKHSPIVLPVQQRPERLAKITSAGPLYRASPIVRPRAGSIGTSPGIRFRGTNIGNSPIIGPHDALKPRLVRKLDIKPHQSPRRLQQRVRLPIDPASPLLLGGKLAVNLREHVPSIELDPSTETATTSLEKSSAPIKQSVAEERQKTDDQTMLPSGNLLRRSSRRRTTRSQYCEVVSTSSSASEPEDEHEDDWTKFELPVDELNVYVPARERATMWAKSLLQIEDPTPAPTVATRKRRSHSKRSIVSRGDFGIGSAILSRSQLEELLQKEPSQMTMGELALTVPKGRRKNLHEQEELDLDTFDGTQEHRVRTLSVSSEAAAFAGSLVTPQVQIIDGQMVVVENTIVLGDDLHKGDQSSEARTGLPPRHPSGRYNSSHPGRRWSKDETKQFFYCLSQVGPNFSIMATLFPTRKRKELKSKFKYEEKRHAKLIDIALRASVAPLDPEMVDVISQMVDKEAHAKVETQRKRKQRDEETSSVASSIRSSPVPSTPQVAFVETTTDDDHFRLNRCGSYDFSG